MPGEGKRFEARPDGGQPERGQPGQKVVTGKRPKHITERARYLAKKHRLFERAILIACSAESSDRDKLAAIKLCLAYAYGQPPQTIIMPDTLTHEERVARLEALAALQGRGPSLPAATLCGTCGRDVMECECGDNGKVA